MKLSQCIFLPLLLLYSFSLAQYSERVTALFVIEEMAKQTGWLALPHSGKSYPGCNGQAVPQIGRVIDMRAYEVNNTMAQAQSNLASVTWSELGFAPYGSWKRVGHWTVRNYQMYAPHNLFHTFSLQPSKKNPKKTLMCVVTWMS